MHFKNFRKKNTFIRNFKIFADKIFMNFKLMKIMVFFFEIFDIILKFSIKKNSYFLKFDKFRQEYNNKNIQFSGLSGGVS